jgi:THO complex subunit 7
MAPKRAREGAAPAPVAKAAKAGGGSAALSREAEEEILRQRLLAKETSLRNLTKRYLSFASAIKSSTTEECEKLYQGLLKELAAYEFGMAKAKNLVAVNVQQVASYESMEGEIGAEMTRTAAEIESLSRQLEEERTMRQQKEQYAALARRIQQLPPRAATEQEIASLNVELVREAAGGSACPIPSSNAQPCPALDSPSSCSGARHAGLNAVSRSHAAPAAVARPTLLLFQMPNPALLLISRHHVSRRARMAQRPTFSHALRYSPVLLQIRFPLTCCPPPLLQTSMRAEGEALTATLTARSRLFSGFMHALHDLQLHLEQDAAPAVAAGAR